MATYSKPCIQCGQMVPGDAHICPYCASRSPFGYNCPNCLNPIQRGQLVCASCGKGLSTSCPYCGGQTFVGSEKCDACGKSLMIRCENSRCCELQFFENAVCTVCGKKIKHPEKQLPKGAR